MAALGRLAADPQRLTIEISKYDLWILLGTIQLACRHPQFIGPTRFASENLCRLLGEVLTNNDPDLRLLFAMGWEKNFDEPRKARPQ